MSSYFYQSLKNNCQSQTAPYHWNNNKHKYKDLTTLEIEDENYDYDTLIKKIKEFKLSS